MNMMKRTAITLLVVLLTTTLSAQKISFDHSTVNVGTTLWHKPVTATFKFKNRDRTPLVIEDVDAGCGCLQPVYTSRPLQRGEEGTISITYDAELLGHFDRIILVRTNASATPTRIRMKGLVSTGEKQTIDDFYPVRIGDVCLTANDVEFPDVVRGDTSMVRIEIMNDTREVYTPQLMHLPPYITATFTPEMLGRSRRGYIDLTLHSDKLTSTGLTQTSIYLARFAGDKVSHENEIRVSAIMLPDAGIYQNELAHPQLHVSTTNLHLGKLGKKKKITGTVTIRNTGHGVLHITSLQAFNSTLQISIPKRELVPGESIDMKVTLLSKFLKDVTSQPRVLLICNDPQHMKETITVSYE